MASIKGYIQLTRPVNLLIAFLSIFMGGFVTGTMQPLTLLMMACISGTLITAAANTINDYFDLEIDRVNKPKRPLPSGRIRPVHAKIFAILLFASGIGVSCFIHLWGLFIACLSAIWLYLYSFKLKRTVIWGNVTVAFISGLAFIYGGMAVGRWRSALVVGIFSFLYHLAREIIKDMEDVEGDRRDGVVTLPIRHGFRAAQIWITSVLILLILITILPYLLGLFNLVYLLVVLAGVDLFLVYVVLGVWKNPATKNLGILSTWMKADMLIGLLAIYLGT